MRCADFQKDKEPQALAFQSAKIVHQETQQVDEAVHNLQAANKYGQGI